MSDSFLRLHLPGLLLLFALLLALLIYAVVPGERVERTLFFPGTTSQALSGERRLIPRTDSLSDDVTIIVSDVLLGPKRIDHVRAFPRNTRLKSVILQDGTAYINLSESAALNVAELRTTLEVSLQALERTILYNFRELDVVVVTIDGKVPFVPAHRLIGP